MNEHFCNEHQVSYTKYEKNGKSWYSHRNGEGYCNEQKSSGSGGGKSYKKDPEDQRRIQRQHSQEMSLRFMDLLVKTNQLTNVTSDLVTKYTDYFEKDLEPK